MFKPELNDLPDSVSQLQDMVIELHKKFDEVEQENDYLRNENAFIREELRLQRLKMFTRISERFQDETGNLQRLLFEDFSRDKDEEESEEDKQAELVIKEHKRKKPGRKPIPEDLPRVEVVHDIAEEDKKCACGSEKSRIGEETSEKMQIEPAKVWVAKHIRPRYACKACEGVEEEDEGKTVVIAPMPPEMIPKSISTPSLLTHIFIGKFLDNQPGIIHCGCWAHVRRKFNDVVKAAGGKYNGRGMANFAMSLIRDLYLIVIERQAKNNGFDEEQTYQLRQESSKSIVEKFEVWLKENALKIPPQSLLGKAFSYTLSQWPRLIKYLDNGLIRMDNNLLENGIRPFVIGRKNWLFSVTPEGARASATFYSLNETAKANGLEPSKYLRYLFERFPYAKTSEDVFNLLPMNILKNDLKK